MKLAATHTDALDNNASALDMQDTQGRHHSLTADSKFGLAESRADALAGKRIDIEQPAGTGNTHTLTRTNEVSLSATSDAEIQAVTVGASVGVGGGAVGTIILSGAGAGSGNDVSNTIEAKIEGGYCRYQRERQLGHAVRDR